MDGGSRPAPSTVRLISLSEDVLVEEHTDGWLTVVTRWGEVTMGAVEALVAGLHRMTLGPVSLHNITGGQAGRLEQALEHVSGSVVHSLGLPDGQPPLLSATPLVARPVPAKVDGVRSLVARSQKRLRMPTQTRGCPAHEGSGDGAAAG